MAFPLLAAAAAFAVAGVVAGGLSQRAQVKAAEKKERPNRRTAQIENVTKARRAIAARRAQEAFLIQAGETQGGGTNSAIAGAVGSLRTQTAANIGLSKTSFAGANLANQQQLKGARRAGNWDTAASAFNVGSSLFLAGSK